MKKARLVNNRPMCFVALSLVAGILIAEALYGVNKYLYLIPTVLFALSAIGLFSFRKTRKFCYVAIAMLVGFLGMCGASDIYDSKVKSYDNVYVHMQGKVDSEIVVGDRMEFYVTDVFINLQETEGRAKVFISSTEVPDFGVGDVVTFVGEIKSVEHEKFDTRYATAYSSKCYYYVFGSSVSKAADGGVLFPRNLQMSIKRMFDENLDVNTSSICKALVLGDKFGMDDELNANVQTSGLAHVLAVSGLHVTALATAVYSFLKKLRVKPKTSLLIVTILTFLYSMLCSFTPSSMRAVIMTFVLNFANAYGYKQDNLSSLSFAAAILLVVNPTNILSVGFLLSMTSVLGIFIAYRPLSGVGMKLVEKISPEKNRGKRFVESLSVSFSANLMSMPLATYFFETIPVLYLVSNLVILPYLMFIYLFLLLITLFAQITTLWGVTFVMQPLLFPFVQWVKLVGSIGWAKLDLTVGVVLVIFYSLACVACSRYVFLNKRVKATIAIVLVACFVAVQTLTLALA